MLSDAAQTPRALSGWENKDKMLLTQVTDNFGTKHPLGNVVPAVYAGLFLAIYEECEHMPTRSLARQKGQT